MYCLNLLKFYLISATTVNRLVGFQNLVKTSVFAVNLSLCGEVSNITSRLQAFESSFGPESSFGLWTKFRVGRMPIWNDVWSHENIQHDSETTFLTQ